MAVEVLKSKGVPEDRILFINLIASPTGVAEFAKKFPRLRVVTAFIDQGLDERKSVLPSIFTVAVELLTEFFSKKIYHPRAGGFWRPLLHSLTTAGEWFILIYKMRVP